MTHARFASLDDISIATPVAPRVVDPRHSPATPGGRGGRDRLDARLRRVTKARLIFGGSCGEGVLMKGTTVSGRYNPASASWGWEAGAESHGCIDMNTPGSAS